MPLDRKEVHDSAVHKKDYDPEPSYQRYLQEADMQVAEKRSEMSGDDGEYSECAHEVEIRLVSTNMILIVHFVSMKMSWALLVRRSGAQMRLSNTAAIKVEIFLQECGVGTAVDNSPPACFAQLAAQGLAFQQSHDL